MTKTEMERNVNKKSKGSTWSSDTYLQVNESILAYAYLSRCIRLPKFFLFSWVSVPYTKIMIIGVFLELKKNCFNSDRIEKTYNAVIILFLYKILAFSRPKQYHYENEESMMLKVIDLSIFV